MRGGSLEQSDSTTANVCAEPLQMLPCLPGMPQELTRIAVILPDLWAVVVDGTGMVRLSTE